VAVSQLKDLFYGECSDEDVALAELSLGPESSAVLGARIHVTAEQWGRIPRVYIECTNDRAVSIGSQRAMVERLPCEKVITMRTDHSPFLSAPEALAAHLMSL